MEPQAPRPSSNTFGLVPMTEDWSIDPPDNQLDDSDEKRKKRLSKSKQWKEVRDYLLQRREQYRAQTPGGVKYNNMPKEDAAFYGGVGNAVIEEIDQFINFVEGVM